MPTFVHRNGRLIEADEVALAWTSGDLSRMLAARTLNTNPVDRHHLLSGIVAQTYKLRADSAMRALCLETAQQHVREFPSIVTHLVADVGVLPRVATYAFLATILTEDRRFEEAMSVCNEAMRLGLRDGTKADFAGRIERIKKAQAKHVGLSN